MALEWTMRAVALVQMRRVKDPLYWLVYWAALTWPKWRKAIYRWYFRRLGRKPGASNFKNNYLLVDVEIGRLLGLPQVSI